MSIRLLHPGGRRALFPEPRFRRVGRSRAGGGALALLVWVAVPGVVALSGWGLATGHAGAQSGLWAEPVVAPVVDGYRPPAHFGAPGNRGWEYRTDPGTAVVAAGDGVVVFAGPIGSSNYVSVLHPDGRRTTYSHVATIGVGVGDAVSAGAPIATSGNRLHFGVRIGDEYRDPGELFAGSAPGTPAPAVGLRLIPAAERAAPVVSRSLAPVGGGTNAAPRMALGPWLASVQLPPGAGGSASGWSGAATDTLADGSGHTAFGP